MPIQPSYQNINIPDAGATVQLVSASDVELYIIKLTQTGTMSGNTSITSDGLDAGITVYNIEFPGGMTLGAQTCTIFGTALTAAQALNRCKIVARWDGSAFQTQVYTDWSEDNTVLLAHMNDDSVDTDVIVDEAVTTDKMVDLSRGSVWVGNASSRPTAVDFKGSGKIPVGDGSDLTSVLMSGDGTLSAAGALTIANNAITNVKILDGTIALAKLVNLARGSIIRGGSTNVPEAYSVSGVGAGAIVSTDGTDVLAQLASGDITFDGSLVGTIQAGLNTYITSVLIPTASVLTGNSVPVSIVGAPGANKVIVPISAIEILSYNSTPYATNGVTNLRHETATDACMTLGTSFLFGTTTKTAVMSNNPINSVTDTQCLANKALLWEVGTGDPTAGDSSVTVAVMYRIVDV